MISTRERKLWCARLALLIGVGKLLRRGTSAVSVHDHAAGLLPFTSACRLPIIEAPCPRNSWLGPWSRSASPPFPCCSGSFAAVTRTGCRCPSSSPAATRGRCGVPCPSERHFRVDHVGTESWIRCSARAAASTSPAALKERPPAREPGMQLSADTCSARSSSRGLLLLTGVRLAPDKILLCASTSCTMRSVLSNSLSR